MEIVRRRTARSVFGLTLAVPLTLCALFFSLGCATKHHAHVDDGAGLTEGHPVMVSGVRVGTVGEVRVVEGQVDVEFEIDSDHEVSLRDDSCALAVRGEPEPSLIIVVGHGTPLAEEQALPQCDLGGEALGDLIEQFGDSIGGLLRSLGSGFFGGVTSGSNGGAGTPIPLPSTPPPMPQHPRRAPPPQPVSPAPIPTSPQPTLPIQPPSFGQPPTCTGLSASVASIERADAVPLLLPQGGYRIWLEFRNTTDQTMEVGAIGRAILIDRARRSVNAVNVPGAANEWFMPFDVPARGTARRSIHVDATESPQLHEIEVRGSSPASGSMSECTLRSTGLSL